jgi:hypothetical protein
MLSAAPATASLVIPPQPLGLGVLGPRYYDRGDLVRYGHRDEPSTHAPGTKYTGWSSGVYPGIRFRQSPRLSPPRHNLGETGRTSGFLAPAASLLSGS